MSLTLGSRDQTPAVPVRRRKRSGLLTRRRGRYRGKTWDKSAASWSNLKRSKAEARRDRMEQYLKDLGDPREEQSLEEKKQLALFYYFSQVQPNSQTV